MTGGRIDLGVGFGRRGEASQEDEFKILGLDPRARMKMSEEAVHIMRRLWRGNDVAYTGEFTSFDHVTIEPKPIQPGGVPIWMASNDVEAGLRRVGRMGDAWMNNIKDPETYRICWKKLCTHAVEAGRDPDRIQPGAYFTIAAGGREAVIEGEKFLAEYYNRTYEAIVKAALCLAGSWDEVLDRLEAFIDAGARTVVLRFAARDQFEQVEKCAEVLHRRGWLG
jgi:alkanesulfonate monooxygenase SsuD/methylene tetrahydromethanopterin reductase-like flavin-dependent oxidoreductase (luciferase family)